MYDIKADTYTEDFLLDFIPVEIQIDDIPGVTQQKISGRVSVDGGLFKDNTEQYSVTQNYNPAHKKYVDDKIDELRVELS